MKNCNHTFVLCAYKQNQYLEQCLQSLIQQTIKSQIIISTSTPNNYIEGIAENYSIPICVNKNAITNTAEENFNYGYSLAKTKYVTLVHQDDIYNRNYTEIVLDRIKERKTIIAFTDYYELRGEQKNYVNQLLQIKRKMNKGFQWFPKSKFVRNRILSFGNPICCPSVTYAKQKCPENLYNLKFHCCSDWDVWSRLAHIEGEFIYIDKPLLGHRIHENSATTLTIENGIRETEERLLFERYWPKFIADKLVKKYKKAALSNQK